MLCLLTATSALALSTAAIAQDTPPPADKIQPEMTEPADEAAVEAAPATESAPEMVAPSRAESVRQIVDDQFPSYDADQSGELSQEEFTAWVTALRQQSLASQSQPPVPDNEMKYWAKNAFAKADTDKSEKVSKAELQAFLTGQPA